MDYPKVASSSHGMVDVRLPPLNKVLADRLLNGPRKIDAKLTLQTLIPF